jgi:hypothetical protein
VIPFDFLFVDIEHVNGEPTSRVHPPVTLVTFKVLRLLVLNQNFLVVKVSIAVPIMIMIIMIIMIIIFIIYYY